MSSQNWGMLTDGGAFESLMHTILFAEDPGTILFGRPGKDAGQDARSSDGTVVYQAKYRQGLNMAGLITLALEELEKIKNYQQPSHANYIHWQNAQRWILVANSQTNPNDEAKWRSQVAPAFKQEGIVAEYWDVDILEAKLIQHPAIKDVFFGGENRILVGLKEAHDLLSVECIGSLSLDTPIIGRDSELASIKYFASSGDKRLLPVIGPGGIGKTRLLYEGLVSLAQDDWRVLWALPGSMARSSQWFRLLNGTQKTCVALDAPDDPSLLRLVIEQLATVERRNWCVIVAYRTEKALALQRFKTNRHVHEPLLLTPLDEPNSHVLVNACLRDSAQPSWLHSVYRFTNGVPGWLCLIGEMAKRGALPELPPSSDDVAALYVDSCIDELGDVNRNHGRTVLRWLALWGTLAVEAESTGQVKLSFLAEEHVPKETARELLRRFVDAGIVRNWGVRKRLYAVEPLIVRHHILSSWLYRKNKQGYEVNEEGHRLVSLIVKDRVPAADSVLNTLSHLARSRMDEHEVYSFLKPLFESIAYLAANGNVRDQYRIAGLIQNAGAADPESALDILTRIRMNPKVDMGDQAFTHDALVASLPWTLFQLAEDVSDSTVARRYLEEFRQLLTLEDEKHLQTVGGRTPQTLLKRILMGSSNSSVFAQPAQDLVVAALAGSDDWPFVGLVAECLLNPIRETVEWVKDWTITITSRPLDPRSQEWAMAAYIRNRVFLTLRKHPNFAFRGQLWEILANSHHEFHRTIFLGKVQASITTAYRQVLVDDLQMCAKILRIPHLAITLEEATHARKLWSWYLEYGKEDDLVGLAQDCEEVYDSLSPWHLHDFFRFAKEEELAPETNRLADLLLKANQPDVFIKFFDEAKRYLDAARHAEDMADDWRISKLADACADQFVIDADAPKNSFTTFTFGVLDQAEPSNPLAWRFVTRMCQRHLFNAKKVDEAAVYTALSALMNATRTESRLLKELYSNVHPSSTGELTKEELGLILEHESDFSGRDWFHLLGPFYALDAALVQERLRGRLSASPSNTEELSECMASFIRSTYLTALRYEWTSCQMPVGWIIDMITSFELDGRLLGMYDLERMRDQSSFRLSMVHLTDLIRSRCELEQNVEPYKGFEIIPHDFAIGDWVAFDETQDTEKDAFHEFSHLALGGNFIAIYWMPKFIRQIDPSGQHVAAFVRHYLEGFPDITGDALGRLGYLASGYENDSSQWAAIARPICKMAVTLPRSERERVYCGLSRKETGVLMSMPGEVPDYYVKACETATRLRDAEPSDSPLKEYREWALRHAQAEFKEQQGWAEEVADG